jgi:hypothetical protein
LRGEVIVAASLSEFSTMRTIRSSFASIWYPYATLMMTATAFLHSHEKKFNKELGWDIQERIFAFGYARGSRSGYQRAPS